MSLSSLPKNLRIGVLRGGPSSEYDVSIQTGANVLRTLSETHKPIDIFISKDGTWHIAGVEKNPEKILLQVDVIFNALHGDFGEDGKVQHILRSHGVPFTGSLSLPSAVGMNKVLSKELYKRHNIKTPQYTSLKIGDSVKTKAVEVFKNFLMPVIVKPASSGSSFGITLASSIPEIIEAIYDAFEYGDIVIIEEYIKGKEATCGVVEGLRGESLYPLVPVEIRHKKKFFDYNSKYSDDETEEICPGIFSPEEKKMIEKYAKEAHKALGLSHYSRSDFIVSPRRGIFILETNTLPGLTEKSLFPKSLEAVGVSMKDFVHHLLHLAIDRK